MCGNFSEDHRSKPARVMEDDSNRLSMEQCQPDDTLEAGLEALNLENNSQAPKASSSLPNQLRNTSYTE